MIAIEKKGYTEKNDSDWSLCVFIVSNPFMIRYLYYEKWKYVLRQYQQWVYESNQDVTGSNNKDGTMIMFEFLIRLVLLQILSTSFSPKK